MTRRALVADDSRMMTEYLKSILQRLGYAQIDVVGGGRQAVSLLAAGRYDLVVLDQNMPEMSGLDVVRDLKYSRLAAGAAIMIVT